MGIETAIIAGVALAATAATTGYQAKRAHDQSVNARHEADKQAAQQKRLQDEAQASQQRAADLKAASALRFRQRALASSYGNTGSGATVGAYAEPNTAVGTLGETSGAAKTRLGA